MPDFAYNLCRFQAFFDVISAYFRVSQEPTNLHIKPLRAQWKFSVGKHKS